MRFASALVLISVVGQGSSPQSFDIGKFHASVRELEQSGAVVSFSKADRWGCVVHVSYEGLAHTPVAGPDLHRGLRGLADLAEQLKLATRQIGAAEPLCFSVSLAGEGVSGDLLGTLSGLDHLADLEMRVVTIIESDLSKINSILLLGIVPFPIGRGTERYRSDGQCRPCQP